MLCIPARSIIATNGNPFQILTTIAAGNATFTNQDINQTAGTFHVGTLNASNSKLTFNTTEENGVTVGTLTGDLKLEAGASVTEKLGSAEKVAGALDSIIGGAQLQRSNITLSAARPAT